MSETTREKREGKGQRVGGLENCVEGEALLRNPKSRAKRCRDGQIDLRQRELVLLPKETSMGVTDITNTREHLLEYPCTD